MRRLLLGWLLLTSPVEAAELRVTLPDATLQQIVALVCANSWAVHHVAPRFSCTDPDPATVIPALAAEMGATVEVRHGDQALETP